MAKATKEKKVVMTAKCVMCGTKDKGFWTDFPLCPKCGNIMIVEAVKLG